MSEVTAAAATAAAIPAAGFSKHLGDPISLRLSQVPGFIGINYGIYGNVYHFWCVDWILSMIDFSTIELRLQYRIPLHLPPLYPPFFNRTPSSPVLVMAVN